MELYFLLGYLGSGKTSALNNLLADLKGNSAVIINDFGALDVDGEMVEAKNKISITGGSIFCSCKTAEFTESLRKTLLLGFDNIVVESSGLANPFTLDSATRLSYELAGLEYKQPKSICLIDCLSFEKLCPIVRMIGMQAACADLILLNKSDLVTAADTSRICGLVRQLNANAKIESTKNGKISRLDFILVEKTLPSNIMDITAAKCLVRLGGDFGESYNKLTEMCERLSEFCHRIKGVVVGKVFQYANGLSSFGKVASGEGNFLVLLKCGVGDLKKQAEQVINDYGFAKLENNNN